MHKLVLGISLLVVAAIATFMLIDVFGGPVKGNTAKQDPAYNPAGYGKQGSKIASTANQATNVLNTIGKDSSQVGADITQVVGVTKGVMDFIKGLGGNSSGDDPGPGAIGTDNSAPWVNTNFSDTSIA